MAHDERNLAAFELIKIQVVKFLKRIAPRSVKGYVHFGAQDPATTGQILMYLSIIYPVLPRKLKLEPDFDEALVYGNIDIKGRLALIFVLVYLLRIVMNKDCKRMWRIYKRHSGRQ